METRKELIAALEEEHGLVGLQAPPEAAEWSEHEIREYFASDGELKPSRGPLRVLCLHGALHSPF